MLITIKLFLLCIKKDLLLLYFNFKYKIMIENFKRAIEYSMFHNKVTKKELSEYMEMSYPTMLKYLSDPGLLKINDANRLCNILNLSLNELLNN